MGTLHIKDIPDSHHELFITKGYRPVPTTLKTALLSAFAPHNELINFWTHFIPGVEMVRQLWIRQLDISEPRQLSMVLFMTSIVVLFMTSSFAHLLNCISFRARHICFCSDYAAILYYTIGCALVNAASVVPDIIWNRGFISAHQYLSLNVGLCGLILVIICQTRMPKAKNKYLARTLSFVAPFFLANYPFIKMYFDGNFPMLEYYFNVHVLSLLIGAIFNVSKYPEKLMPGQVNYIFLSHHFMHVGTAIGVYANFYLCLDQFNANMEQAARYTTTLQIILIATSSAFFIFYIYYFSLRFISQIKPSDYVRKNS